MDSWNLLPHLEDYAVSHPEEAKRVKGFTAFFYRHSDFSFSRENKRGHFTASAWVMSPDRQKALLMHHRKLNKWIQLGGHADGDTQLSRVALKEAEEESGIRGLQFESLRIFDLDQHEIPERKEEPSHLHWDVRFLLRSPTEKFVGNPESFSLEWFAVTDSFFNEAEASIKQMHAKWVSYLHQNYSDMGPNT